MRTLRELPAAVAVLGGGSTQPCYPMLVISLPTKDQENYEPLHQVFRGVLDGHPHYALPPCSQPSLTSSLPSFEHFVSYPVPGTASRLGRPLPGEGIPLAAAELGTPDVAQYPRPNVPLHGISIPRGVEI